MIAWLGQGNVMAFAIACSPQRWSFPKKNNQIATALVNRLHCDAFRICFQGRCNCHQVKVYPRFHNPFWKEWNRIFQPARDLTIRRLANGWSDISDLLGAPIAPVGGTLFPAYHYQVTAKAAFFLLRLGPSACGDPRPSFGDRRHAPAAPVSNLRARPFRPLEAPQGVSPETWLRTRPVLSRPLHFGRRRTPQDGLN